MGGRCRNTTQHSKQIMNPLHMLYLLQWKLRLLFHNLNFLARLIRVHFSIVDMGLKFLQSERTQACNGDRILLGPCFCWSKYGICLCKSKSAEHPIILPSLSMTVTVATFSVITSRLSRGGSSMTWTVRSPPKISSSGATMLKQTLPPKFIGSIKVVGPPAGTDKMHKVCV